MPLLIATDEAGYGPKLGPLVIVATAWQYDDSINAPKAFANFGVPIDDPRCGSIRIDDSKRTFKRATTKNNGHIAVLDEVCQAASQWVGIVNPAAFFLDWLRCVALTDVADAIRDPWFKNDELVSQTPDPATNDRLVDHWSRPGVEMLAIGVRFLTPRCFNDAIDRGRNKADLLTESTCGLAIQIASRCAGPVSKVVIASDRHGGRNFYAAALQHASGGASVKVLHEGKPSSHYELIGANGLDPSTIIDWSFTIGGDSFAPVAMSSMIAKWTRERAMADFNRYFANQMPSGTVLAPTAGYPSDADRFLTAIRNAGLRSAIDDSVLIRKR